MMSNSNKKYLAQTMTVANNLQIRYDVLGASPYQRVRNPKPMYELVEDILPVLPVRPKDNEVFSFKKKIRLTRFGKTTVHEITINKTAKELGIDKMPWKSALTIKEIVSHLQQQGFIANYPSVCVALTTLRRIVPQWVQSFHDCAPDSRKTGKGWKRFYMSR